MKFDVVRRGLLAMAVTTAITVSGTAVANASVAAPTDHRPAMVAAAAGRPVITAQPRSVVILPGTAQFSVAATGIGLNYQWQLKAPGILWRNISGATLSKYRFVAGASRSGNQLRVVIRNAGGQVISSAATLTVITKPKITGQPAAKRAIGGSQATFIVRTSGYGVKYRWQQLLPGKPWTFITAANKSSLSVLASSARNGSSYRVVLNNAAGQTISARAKLTVVKATVAKPRITGQPTSKRVTAGTIATFSVRASGTGVSYRWQKLGGKTWTSIAGATRSSYAVRAVTAQNGAQYRVVLRNGGGEVISRSASLGVQSTRSDPKRIGQSTDLKGWRVRLADSNTDAWARAKAQGFEPGPAEGNHYVAAHFDVRYLATGSSIGWLDLDVEFVGSNGRTYADTDKFYWSNDIYSLGEMYHNATGTFASVVEAPASAVIGGRWKITDWTDWMNPVVVWYAAG